MNGEVRNLKPDLGPASAISNIPSPSVPFFLLVIVNNVEVFTEKVLAKEARIGYGLTKAVSLPANHGIRLSAAHLGFPIRMSSASTGTGCGVVSGDLGPWERFYGVSSTESKQM